MKPERWWYADVQIPDDFLSSVSMAEFRGEWPEVHPWALFLGNGGMTISNFWCFGMLMHHDRKVLCGKAIVETHFFSDVLGFFQVSGFSRTIYIAIVHWDTGDFGDDPCDPWPPKSLYPRENRRWRSFAPAMCGSSWRRCHCHQVAPRNLAEFGTGEKSHRLPLGNQTWQ